MIATRQRQRYAGRMKTTFFSQLALVVLTLSFATADDALPKAFIAGNGRKVEVQCTLNPVIELRGRAVIGLRFRRVVTDAATGWEFTPQEIERLSRTDRLRIDRPPNAQAA